MQKLMLIFGIVVLFTACKNKTATDTPASQSVVSEIKEAVTNNGLKSASYETVTEMPGGMGTTHSKISFDDYGKKSKTEMTTAMSFGGKSMNSAYNSLMVDGYVYSWANSAKKVNKFKMDESKFDPSKSDFSKLSEEMRKKMNFKDEGTEMVNGRECRVSSYTTEQMKGKIWLWKQIPAKMEMTMSGKVVTTNVINIEENPSFPAGTFDVPSDIEFKEMNLHHPVAVQ